MVVLIGASCSGKDTIKKELIKRGMKSLVTTTTRPPRDGETNGVTYNFIDQQTFLKLKEDGFFAETTLYRVANSEEWYYGTGLEDLKNADDNTVVILNPDGFRSIRKIEGLNIMSFYIDAKKSIIKKRLKKRGDNRKEAKRRMKADEIDFRWIDTEVDYTINNNGLLSIEDIVDVIQYFYNLRVKRG